MRALAAALALACGCTAGDRATGRPPAPVESSAVVAASEPVASASEARGLEPSDAEARTLTEPAWAASIDRAVGEAIARRDAPGAVVVVISRGRVALRKAYGDRTRIESDAGTAIEPMTIDTLFDLASLTKPL